MTLTALAFLIGIIVLQHCEVLPALIWSGLLLLLVPLSMRVKPLRFPLVFFCGFLWALLQAQAQLYPQLAPQWEGSDLVVEGVIASIPEIRGPSIRFEFDIERLSYQGQWQTDFPQRVRLSWYGQTPALSLVQKWRFTVRLKPPRGFKNPGGFDYEGWLFQRGIRATGYVRQGEDTVLLADRVLNRPIDLLRRSLAEHIAKGLGENPNRGVITALTIGDRTMMSPQHWSLLLATGTNHLLAISGLHIGLVAGLFYLVMIRVWALGGRLCLKWPAQRGAALIALGVACFYALLAGFSVPTQRAVLMLSVVMGAIIFNRVARPMHTLAFALLVVLIWDSLAVLSVGFWLSFSAVAVILYAVIGRLAVKRPWWHWGRTQWILAIGLFPLVLIFFQRASLVAPLANLIAVPWVGLLVVPVTLAGSLSAVVFPAAGAVLLSLASTLLDLLWVGLDLLIRIPLAVWHHSPPSWTLIPAILGIALLLAPRGWPGRWLGVIFFSPLVLASPARPELGGYWITLLDVGQGLSIVIQTHNHTLLYDAGPKFSEYFNAGDAAVLPYLRFRGIDSIDLMVVSHGDSDHMGGADAVKETMLIERILTSVPEQIDHAKVDHCMEGMGWGWDGVEFEFLHPTTQQGEEGNDQSCVLLLRSPGGSTLITGDIELDAEQRLLETYGDRLASDIMLIPHHGSLTSSSLNFVEAVNPQIALLSVGFHNRFDLPSQRVTDRYKAFGVKVLDTANHGAVRVFVDPDKGIEIRPGYRQSDKRYWSGVSTDIQPFP